MQMCRCCGSPAKLDEHGFTDCCGETVEESVPCVICGREISPTYSLWGMCDDCEERTRDEFAAYWNALPESKRECLKFLIKRDYFEGGIV